MPQIISLFGGIWVRVSGLMTCRLFLGAALLVPFSLVAAPVIDPLGNVSVPSGRSLSLPITANSPNNRPLTFSVTSSTNAILAELPAHNPYWKMSVVQAVSNGIPGSYLTPYRGGLVNVTNMGDMTFMLFRDRAPRTVDVFMGLTASGFYNSNTIFHRVVPGFVIQAGDPQTNGSGGPVFQYDDEFAAKALFTGNGQLGVANSGKDTDGSQFFVTLGTQRGLDFAYPMFGQLLRGFDVMTNISKAATNGASRPLNDVIITHASQVPDTSDTVLTLTANTAYGAVGTIAVVADDGAGGRVTNTFSATVVSNTVNDQPFINVASTTNLLAPVNSRITNFFTCTDVDGDMGYWFVRFSDTNSAAYGSNSVTYVLGSVLELVTVPNNNYAGPININVVVSSSSLWNSFPTLFPYDRQTNTFVFGDTPIGASPGFVSGLPMTPLTGVLLASFTNGIGSSPTNAFTASVNWGDNTVDAGTIATNIGGWKEVRGSHTYTNAGTYPVYVTVQSTIGAKATVVSTAAIAPAVSIAASGSNAILQWPAWAVDYQLQSATNPVSSAWTAATNLPVLSGYMSIATNTAAGNGNGFFRLKR